MTGDDPAAGIPFWRRKRLDEMTDPEWESLCDGCGRCCLEKLEADDTAEVYFLDVGCELLDTATGGCSDYANRLTRVPKCSKLTPARLASIRWLPSTCAYSRLFRGEDLEWWHPLVSGDPDSVRAAGISAAGRFIEPRFAGAREYHSVDWPARGVTSDPRMNWEKAMFGGVNAAVPTPFGADRRVDLELMAAHCFWLLSNGCGGIAVLDKVGEAASLAIGERILVMQGLVERGVPASKLLAGIGPASVEDGLRIAGKATELGIRGLILNSNAFGPIVPGDLITGPMRDLIGGIDPRSHLYLSISVSSSSASACLTALEMFMARAPGRLRGIRDETAGGALGLAALERFLGSGFEVYAQDEAMLGRMLERGGAGSIGPGANLLGRHCSRLPRAATPEQASRLQPAIEAVTRMLRSRPVVPAVKALLAYRTGRTEWDALRLPLRPLGQAERTALFRAFDATGVAPRPSTRPGPRV